MAKWIKLTLATVTLSLAFGVARHGAATPEPDPTAASTIDTLGVENASTWDWILALLTSSRAERVDAPHKHNLDVTEVGHTTGGGDSTQR